LTASTQIPSTRSSESNFKVRGTGTKQTYRRDAGFWAFPGAIGDLPVLTGLLTAKLVAAELTLNMTIPSKPVWFGIGNYAPAE
jgi:hypothetical protein